MNLETLQPRVAAGIGLLALIPTVWYAFGRPSTAGFVASVNVLVIFSALWVTMRPIDETAGGRENGGPGNGDRGNGGYDGATT